MFRKKIVLSQSQTPVVVNTFHRSHRRFPLRALLRFIVIISLVGLILYFALPPALRYARHQYYVLRGMPDSELVVAPVENRPTALNNSSAPAASTPNSGPLGQSQTSACGVAGMPQEVCDIAKSIESNGVKNNPYVVGMTDSIPDSATFTLNYGSWKLEDEKSGYMSGSAHAYALTKPGTITFHKFSGSWKVTSLELDD